MVELDGFLLTPDGLESLGDPALGLYPQVLDATWKAAKDRPDCAPPACASATRRSRPVRDGACLLVVSDAAADHGT